MTRETKVGLVVGTGIILLIGIIVSDHLSSSGRGNQTPAPPGYANNTETAGNGSTGGTGGARVINPRGQERTDAAPADPRRDTPIVPADQLNPQNNTRPGIEIARVDPNNPQRGAGDAAGTRVIVPPGNPGNDASGASNATGNANNASTPGAPGAPGTPGGTGDRNLDAALHNNGFLDSNHGASNAAGNTPGNGDTNNSGNASAPLTRQPEPIIHFVQPGERLWNIAEKHYGHGKYWTIIAKHNADKLVDPATGVVRENVRLVIPHKSIVLPDSSDAAVSGLTNGATGNTAAATNPRAVKVESGDNLTRIAERFYRSTDYAYVKAIVEANRDQIQDADDIKAGMVLKMPEIAAPTTGNAASNTTNTSTTGSNAGNTTDRRAVEYPPRTPSTVKTYKVESGDTFSSIARQKLGSANRWKELFALNKAAVPNANALREGIVLVLPADAR